jgi:serine/threonine-protein kinase
MERIGEYLVKRLVGEGGMGKVYEAEERLTKRRVALKVLRPELTRSEEGRRLFLNEMQILAQIEHPNVVRSLASMESDGQLVMALELLSGRTLRQELTRRGAIPSSEALEIVVQIAEGLSAAHAHEPPIVHRDLKPENVMLLSDEGAPVALKVMDFGIAKVLEAAQATNTQSIGTLQYMSPEQIDARTIDARSDLYSLGLLFYEALSGAPPFRSASPRELLNLQCTALAPPLEDDVRRGLPRGVEDLLFDLLEKDPEKRPASAIDVVERLSPFRPAVDRRARASVPPRSPRAIAERVSDVASSRPRGDAPREDSRASRSGDTMRSPSSRPDAPRTDTVALVERATAPREVPTPLALLLIAALSLIAGMTTYLIRVHSATNAASVTATANAASAPSARAAAR